MISALSALLILSITISGVYYDPIQAEAGGEAIQLHNNGSTPAPLDSISIATKQTSYPLPAVTLLPGSGYLIADNNWSSLRDNSSWPEADLELPLSLANTDGYVLVMQGNETLDNISWNSSFKAREGKMLTHDGEAEAFFWNRSTTVTDFEAKVVVLDGSPLITNITVTDDAPENGIQLLSYNRTIHVSAQVSDPNNETLFVVAEFLGDEYEMHGNSTYSVDIPFTTAPPGRHLLTVRATRTGVYSESQVVINVLSSVSISTLGQLVFIGAPGTVANSSITVINDGNVDKNVQLRLGIPQASCDNATVLVPAGKNASVQCTTTIPLATAGNYSYPVRLIAS